ncbi:hypothetical protein [Aquimarina sp. AU58]|uniref:hypothetical protein n=1 Tax=Aquimarina sp. AU58 TaxID=1874112 RepID=UPI000D6522BB|nr:hypothetical protein [Aquimarina sp. AU58]
MKKQILTLGKILSKVEQKSINGGAAAISCHYGKFHNGCLCNYHSQCASGHCDEGFGATIGLCQPKPESDDSSY